MSNKTERWFVVSERELEERTKAQANRAASWTFGTEKEWCDAVKRMEKAEAACRAREVPEGTRFIDFFHTDAMEKLGSLMLWGETKK